MASTVPALRQASRAACNYSSNQGARQSNLMTFGYKVQREIKDRVTHFFSCYFVHPPFSCFRCHFRRWETTVGSKHKTKQNETREQKTGLGFSGIGVVQHTPSVEMIVLLVVVASTPKNKIFSCCLWFP
jgi:hypothetical protein